MTETKHDDVDWATAAEQSSEDDEAQEGNTLAAEETSVEAAEHAALHVEDENADIEVNLDAALDALVESPDPEADSIVEDALDIDSVDEADASVEAVEDEDEVATDEAEAEADADVDPYDAFRKELRFLPGKWYVIHSYAGFERRVKSNIENRKQSMAMEDFIYQVEVPMEDVVEIKNGQRKMVTRVRIPGYVLVRMDLDEDSW
ncbi:antitermination protein NusG, partial [Cryobacterium sp. MLB-32]|uniref:transcription termination/antitermination NusG family protein n=1 Tax=Cryobacterium sp. MLB-32 TaxID=1529318 RepID=UPI0004E7A77C